MAFDSQLPYDRDTARRWQRDPSRLPLDALIGDLQQRLPGAQIALQPTKPRNFSNGALELKVATQEGARAINFILFDHEKPRLRIGDIRTPLGAGTGAGSACVLGLLGFATEALQANMVSLRADQIGRHYWANNGFTMKENQFDSWKERMVVDYENWLKEYEPNSKRERLQAKAAAKVIEAAAPDKLDAIAALSQSCSRYKTLGRRLFLNGADYSARLILDSPAHRAKVRKKLEQRAQKLITPKPV